MQVYLNIVLDDALEEKPGGEKARIGMVVIRGNAVVMLEVHILSSRSTKPRFRCSNINKLLQALDRINTDEHKGGR
jgi:small nuclear ribonucleoprotein G